MSPASSRLLRQRIALGQLAVTASVRQRGNRLTWIGRLQPTPLSDSYKVQIDYKVGTVRPKVTVLEPNLTDADLTELPHVFRGDALCLHYPNQWRSRDLIATTIVPWISEWLLHYELFKVDGIWHGGGHEPAVPNA